MGVIDENATGNPQAMLELPELIGRDRRQWTLLLVAIRREDAVEAIRRHDEANRYLLI